jgi:hypothetical protein
LPLPLSVPDIETVPLVENSATGVCGKRSFRMGLVLFTIFP